MVNNKMYSANDICKKLNITIYTLDNWYRWEKKNIELGIINEVKLPVPIKDEHIKGKPRRWTSEMVEELKTFKKTMVTGRNGVYGAYSNPNHTNTKKYKKSIENN